MTTDIYTLHKSEIDPRVKDLTKYLNRDVECQNPYFIIIDYYHRSKTKRGTKSIVICICDKKVYIDSYRSLPNQDPDENFVIASSLYKNHVQHNHRSSHSHIHQSTWRNDKLDEMIQQQPQFVDVGIDIKTSPNLILYNKNDPKNFISLITRAEQIENPLMDFLFSSTKKEYKKGFFSVNITIIIYESELHHCLLEYKIHFEEKNGKLERFIQSELIGDSLVIFKKNDEKFSKKKYV